MTEIAVYQQPAELVPIAHSFDDWIPVLQEVVGLATAIHDSPFVPDGLRGSIPAVAAAILTGRELGIPPMTALANIHLIKGKTGLSALLMRALIQSKGHQWEDVTVTDTRVVIKGRRRGEAEWTEASFNADQAKAAGIQMHPYPQDKLYARASVRLARRKFADVIAGMPYSAEELEDDVIEQAETIEPPAPAAEQPKPRTAQRRTRQAADPTASPEHPGAATATAAASQAHTDSKAGSPSTDQPPLPGEDDPEPDDEKRGNGKVGIIQAHFRRLGFTDDEREQRLTAAAAIAGMPEGEVLPSLNDLDDKQLSAVADTLSRCRDRAALIALLAAADA